MIRFIRRLLGLDKLEAGISSINSRLDSSELARATPSVSLMRHILGSLPHFKDIKMTKEERAQYVASASQFFKEYEEKELRDFMLQQALYIARDAMNWEQVCFGRGGIDMLDKLLELRRAQHGEHIQDIMSKRPVTGDDRIARLDIAKP